MAGEDKSKEQKKTGRRIISLEESKDEAHLRQLGFTSEFIRIAKNINPEEAERRQTQNKIVQDPELKKAAGTTQDLGADGLMDIVTAMYKRREEDIAYLRNQVPEKYRPQIKNIRAGVDLLVYIIKNYDENVKRLKSSEKEIAKAEEERKKADKELIEKVERNTTNFFSRFGQFYTDTAERDFWKNTYKNKLMHFLGKYIKESKCRVLSDNGDFKLSISDPALALDVLMELYKYDNDLVTNTLSEHDKLQRDHTAIIKSLESRLPDSYMDFINLVREKTSRRTEKDRLEMQKDLDDAANMGKEDLVKCYQDHRIELRALEEIVDDNRALIPGVEKLSDRVSKINRVLTMLKDYKEKIESHAKELKDSRDALHSFSDAYSAVSERLEKDIEKLSANLRENARVHISHEPRKGDSLAVLESFSKELSAIDSAVSSIIDEKKQVSEEYRLFMDSTEKRMMEYSKIFQDLSGMKEQKEALEKQNKKLQAYLIILKPKIESVKKYETEIAALKKQISLNEGQISRIKHLEKQVASLSSENKELRQRPESADNEACRENMQLKKDIDLLEKKLGRYKMLVDDDSAGEVMLQEDRHAMMMHKRFLDARKAFMKYAAANGIDAGSYPHANLPAVMAHEDDAFLKMIHNYLIFLSDFENLITAKLLPLEKALNEKYSVLFRKLPRSFQQNNVMSARQAMAGLLNDAEQALMEHKDAKDKRIKSFIEDNRQALVSIIKSSRQIEPDADERLKRLENPALGCANQDYYDILDFMSLNREITNAYNGVKDRESNLVSRGLVDLMAMGDAEEGQKLAEKHGYENFVSFKKDIEDLVDTVGFVQQKKELKKREDDFMLKFKYKTLKTVLGKLEALNAAQDSKTEGRLYEGSGPNDISGDYAACREICELNEKAAAAESVLLSKAQRFDSSINTERKAINLVNRLVKKIAEYGAVVSGLADAKKNFMEEYDFVPGIKAYDEMKDWVAERYKILEDIGEEPDEESRICQIVQNLDAEKGRDYNASRKYLAELVGQPDFVEVANQLSYFKGLKGVFKTEFNSAEGLLDAIKSESKGFRPYLNSLRQAQERLYQIEQEFKDGISQAKKKASGSKKAVIDEMNAQKEQLVRKF